MARPVGRLGSLGLARFAVRLVALTGWLVASLTLHGLWRLARRHSPWPRRFLAGLCRLVGVRISQVGSPVPAGAILLVNHVSWIDVPALAGLTGAAFVAHDGLAGIAPLRWLCALNDTVFIARHDRRSIHRQVDQVREALRDTGALALFPEGTTGDGEGLLPFKSSLLAAVAPPPEGIAIQPVLLDYGRRAAEIAWVGDEHGTANFLRIVGGAEPIDLTIRFLPPLAPDEAVDRKHIAHAARQAMLAAQGAGH
jgi:1-acyl-sn-glycerol-3-phosphate acyltransferase